MGGLADFWSGLFEGRHRELLREVGQERLARESRRARRDGRVGRPATPEAGGAASGRVVVRIGTGLDAPRIADLLELNGMPRWVAFEERFILLEEGMTLTAAMRFRAGTERLYLGLLVTDPWAEEHSLAMTQYSRARAMARDLGLGEVSAQTRRHEGQLYEAGYRRRGGTWRTPS
jgi:hypothetical protein